MNGYSKTERQRLITEKIISYVYANRLKTGDKMPSENQLSKALNVPRASVRQVYGALELVGIVECRRGEGTFLRAGIGSDNMIFSLMMLALHDDKTDVPDIMEIRKIIETGIAEKAAKFRTESDARVLRRIIREMRNCTDGNRLSELDNELHSTIGGACGNELLSNLSDIISGITIRSIREHWKYILFDRKMDTRQKTFEQHRELVDAIVNRKPNIAKLVMEEHLEFVCMSLDRYKAEFADYEAQIQTKARAARLSYEGRRKGNNS